MQREFRHSNVAGHVATQIIGDASIAYIAPFGPNSFIYNAPITANRGVYLPTAGLYDGQSKRISRLAGSTGAFSVNVRSTVSGSDILIHALSNPGDSVTVEYSVELGDWVVVGTN